MRRIILAGILLAIIVISGLIIRPRAKLIEPAAEVSPSPIASPSPSPSPSPLSFSQMNQLYGPCVYGPTLMYHHIAQEAANLTVTIEFFRKQMEYLRDRGYTVTGMGELTAFFDQGQALGKKIILLTFDDAYEDFFTNAYPVLREFGFKATVFVPTGLVNNPGYLSWGQIAEMNGSGLITFGNHTWSHNNLGGSKEKVNEEIGLADTQLTEHEVNSVKVLVYPYGTAWNWAETAAQEKGYVLGFTTNPGSILCNKMRLSLPRIRVGNANLDAYGF